MNYTIVDIYEDMAGKYRARIDTEYNSIYLKFDHYPTTNEIDFVFTQYLQAISNNLEN